MRLTPSDTIYKTPLPLKKCNQNGNGLRFERTTNSSVTLNKLGMFKILKLMY